MRFTYAARIGVIFTVVLGVAVLGVNAASAATAPVTTVTVGANPQLPAVTNSLVFVPNQNSNNVSVIDRVTNTVTNVIDVGGAPSAAIVVGSYVYVRLSEAKSYVVINPSTLGVQAVIPVGSQPSLPAIGDSGMSVAVSNAGDGTVTLINGVTSEVAATVTVGAAPTRPAFGTGANSSKIFVPSGTDGTVSVISVTTNAVVDSVNVTGKLGDAVATPDGKYILLPQKGTVTSIQRIDQSTLAVEMLRVTDGDEISKPINVVQNGAAYIAPAAWMVQAGSTGLGKTEESQDSGTWTKGPIGAGAVSGDGAWALYSSPAEEYFDAAPYVTLVNTSNLKLTAMLKVGNTPATLAFAPTGAVAYVSNAGDGTVSVLDLATQYWSSAPRKVKDKEVRSGWGMSTTVSWKAPKRAGAGGITKTMVRPTDTRKNCSTKKTSCTVKNLSAHKGYAYEVRALTTYAIGQAGWAYGK